MKTTMLTLNLLVALVLLTLSGVLAEDTNPPQCPAGWSTKLGRCYYFSNTTADWFKAWQSCGDLRAHLLSVETKVEGDKVVEWINTYSGGKYNWWTSGCNDNALGVWTWYGTLNKITYQNACRNEAYTSGVTFDQHCLSLSTDCGYQWLPKTCSDASLRYVCEKDAVYN